MAAKPGKENKRNAYKGSYYTYGNVAYELQPDYAPYYEDDKKQQEAKEAIRQAAAERRENRMHAAHVCMVMLLIFAGCIAIMGATVIVKNQEVQIREKKDELATLKSQNAILEAELAEQIDLEYIKQEAINRLGMAEPQPYQIVYIDVPKDSYTIQYAADEVVEEEPSFIASILNLFKKD